MKLSQQKLRCTVIGLCLLAAIRVFVFAAAFPFFNNVDEQAHVDLVIKYAHAKPPRGIEPFASEAALCIAVYSTPEYFFGPEQYGGQYPPPNWLLPREQLEKVVNDEVPFWESRLNHESGEPPLYYALAGGWMRHLTHQREGFGRESYHETSERKILRPEVLPARLRRRRLLIGLRSLGLRALARPSMDVRRFLRMLRLRELVCGLC